MVSQFDSSQLEQVHGSKKLVQFLEENKLGEIMFCASEVGRWSTVGGLGVMVDELTQGLAVLNQQISMISPYYHENKKGETNYLATDKEKFIHLLNIQVYCQNQPITIGVHKGVVNNVTLYFLHNAEIFPRPYCDGDAEFTLKQMVIFAKACLELTIQINKLPSLIVTNDWFTSLVAAYARNKNFGEHFNQTKFFHIVHNLDPMYEGRLYPKENQGDLWSIHQLPKDWLVDPYWEQMMLNPSRCALTVSDQWGTVSVAYCKQLLQESPLQSILKKFKKPFAFPNGIRKQQRHQVIIDTCNDDHTEAKKRIQQKYFGFKDLDDSICLMAFVGRITEQKGVHLILESVQTLMQTYNGKLQIIVGGMATMSDPYGSFCASLIYNLKKMYPFNFWGAPGEFFYDGSLINCGADFALMPSKFEPGGIVQQEFFVGSTPVIAHKTGGLIDTVIDYDYQKKKGCGFTFQTHTTHDLIKCIDRAMKCFQDRNHYKQIRLNSFDAVIDVKDVAKAWCREFYNLSQKLFIDEQLSQYELQDFDQSFDLSKYDPKSCQSSQVKGGIITEQERIDYYYEKTLKESKRLNCQQHSFKYKTSKFPRPTQIFLIGTFDDNKWETKYPLFYDQFTQTWSVSLKLQTGEYFYKYIVDGEYICNENEPKNNDIYGNINNFIVIN